MQMLGGICIQVEVNRGGCSAETSHPISDPCRSGSIARGLLNMDKCNSLLNPKRTSRKTNRGKFFQRASLVSTSHMPYWDVEKCEKAGMYASTSNRTRQALEHIRRQRLTRNMKVQNFYNLTLSEALQARTEVRVREAEKGIFSGKLSTRHTLKVYEYTKQSHKMNEDISLDEAILIHKSRNPHHPDTLRRRQEWWETVETLLDLLSSAQRIDSHPTDAFERSWDWVCYNRSGFYQPRQKFSHLSPLGVLVYLVWVERHGLSREHMPAYREASNRYRNSRRVGLELVDLYAMETHYHAAMVNVELAKLSIKAHHDHDKFFADIVWAYAHGWTNKRTPSPERKLVSETMLDVKVQASAEQMREAISGAVNDGLADSTTRANLSHALAGAIAPQITQFSELLTSLQDRSDHLDVVLGGAEKVLETTNSKLGPILGNMDAASGDFASVAESLKRMVDGFTSASAFKSIPFLAELPQSWWSGMGSGEILYLIQMYILYANCTSWAVRSVLVAMVFHRLGIFDKFMEGVSYVFRLIKEQFVETAEDKTVTESIAEFIGGLFDNIDARKCAIIGTITIFILCGRKLKWGDMSQLGSNIMDALRNVHVVGLGALGSSRILEKLEAIISASIAWIKEHVLRIPPKRDDLSVDITKWLVRVKFYSTDEGISLIRASKKSLDEASSLYAQGINLRLRISKAPKFPQEEARLVIEAQRGALIIHNTCFRIKNYTSFRPTMFHTQFVGNPGVGKSTLTTAFVSHLKRSLFPSHPGNNLVYALADTDHFDGYAGQLFIIGDDLWKYNDAKHCTTIISLITNTPVLLPMAHLEDKGTYLTSEFMISSVNKPYPKITDVLCLEAVYRRRHCLISVECDKDVINESTCKYDDVLWKRKYLPVPCEVQEEQELRASFPHLSFSFLKPVPDLKQRHETTHLKPDGTLNLDVAYLPGDELPTGLEQPLINLSWADTLKRVESRYQAMRSEERKAGIEDRKRIMEVQWSEVDDAIDEFYAGEPTQEHMYGWYLPADINMRISSEQAEAIALAQDNPALSEEMDNLTTEILDELDRISGNDEEVTETMDAEATNREAERRARILRARGRREPEARQLDVRERPMSLLKTIEGKRYMRLAMSYDYHHESRCRVPVPPPYINPTNADDRLWKRILGEIYKYGSFYQGMTAGDRPLSRRFSRTVNMSGYENFGQGSVNDARLFNRDFLCRLVRNSGEWYYELENQGVQDLITSATMARQRTIRNVLAGALTLTHIGRDEDPLWERVKRQYKGWTELLDIATVNNPYNLDLNDPHTIVFRYNEVMYFVYNDALLTSMDPVFQDMSRTFLDCFNQGQQNTLVRHAQIAMRILPTAFYENTWLNRVREFAHGLVQKFKRFMYWFWTRFMSDERLRRSIMLIMAAGAVIGGIKSLARLLTIKPIQVEETSKFLHKPKGSTPIYGVQHTMTLSKDAEFTSVQRRNTRLFFHDGGKFNGIVSRQYVYTVWHAVRNLMALNRDFSIFMYPTNTVQKDPLEIPIRCQDVIHFPNSDFCVIYSPLFPDARDIDDRLILSSDVPHLRGHELAHLYVTSNGPQSRITQPLELEDQIDIVTLDNHKATYKTCLKVTGMALSGSSGGPIVTAANIQSPRIICGIQSMNKDPCAYVQCVTKEMVDYCKNLIKPTQPIIKLEGPLVCDETLAPQKEKLVDSHLDICGGVPKEYIAGCVSDTKFVKTILADSFPTNSVPAILNGRSELIRKNNHPPGSHPLAHSVNKSGRDVMKPFSPKLVDQAVEDVSAYMKWSLNNPELRVLNLKETFMGHDHPGSGSIELKTSPGLPYVLYKYPGKPKGKKAYIQFDWDWDPPAFEVSDEVLEDFHNTELAMAEGFIPANSMYEFPKDELRPREKAYGDGLQGKPMKTRSITVMSMVHALLFRKYHLDLTAHMHVAADGDFQSCVGINPEGPEWVRLYSNLARVSKDHCFDLDVGNWDGHMTPQLFWAVVRIVNRLYGDDDFSQNGKIRFAIAHNAVFGYDQWEDLLIKKQRGMPSGFGGTAIYNTIAHMLTFYMLYLELAKRNGKDAEYGNFSAYQSHIAVFFYGDDVIGSFNPRIVEWCNALTMSQLYSEYGWPTTSAAKNGQQQAYKSIYEVQFLKRMFEIDLEFGEIVVHPMIDISVIDNLLHWMRVNSRTCIQEQLRDNIDSALSFACPHGRTYYERLRAQINNRLAVYKIPPYLISYEQMRNSQLFNRYGIGIW